MNNPDQKYLVCPYDVSHVICKSRMLVHLSKCAKNFLTAEKRPCPFNNMHIVSESEMQNHIDSCPDRGKLTNYLHTVGDITCPVKHYLPINFEMPPSDENWDNDVHTGSVLTAIKERAAEKDIILTNALIGQTKSKRKDFRMNEVKRHTKLREQKLKSLEATENTATVSDVDIENQDPEEIPIRPPLEMSSVTKKRHTRLTEAFCDGDSGGIIAGETGSQSSQLKGFKRSSKGASGRSYASFLAEYASILNTHNDNTCGHARRETIGASHVGCKVQQRGRLPSPPGLLRVPASLIRLQNPTASVCSSKTSFVSKQIDRFPTDKCGFLTMPIPGKGRGGQSP